MAVKFLEELKIHQNAANSTIKCNFYPCPPFLQYPFYYFTEIVKFGRYNAKLILK
jgi:hypothetical protein